MRLGSIVAAALALLSCLAGPAAASGFGDWAAIVVAGDYHAHSGADSEVFDNARRDIAADLESIGFSQSNVMQFSVRPERYPLQRPRHSDGQMVSTSLWDLSNGTSGGCFAYYTSHGSPEGLVMGDDVLTPKTINQVISNACGDRPTVVFISACYSGVFVPLLAAPNRMIVTAARRDRTSFGCGESDRYTFFDTCFLQYFKGAGDFPNLANEVKACVSEHEAKLKVDYPSEPQISIGANVAALLPKWK